MNQDAKISLLSGIRADRMVAEHLQLDESLLPDLRREIAHRGNAEFIGLHVLGSHWEYDARYSAAFERFGSATDPSDTRILNAYDNSIAYTDWFLEQVIEAVRTLPVPATVTYISDHGEDLYPLDGNTGHGTPTYSKQQFDIPAFVWMNRAYREAHPDIVRAITQNAGKEIRSHNLFYSLADIMGIHWPVATPLESFASSAFVPDSRAPLVAGGLLVTPP
jgi:glucan phosphoethanolaminetransferase (alkaline phosphatase superfamily)